MFGGLAAKQKAVESANFPPPSSPKTESLEASSTLTTELYDTMTIKIGHISFEGPFAQFDQTASRSGVYVILGVAGLGGYHVIDVGESRSIRDRLASHDREPQWSRHARSPLFAAYYCDEVVRMRVEKELRLQFNPPCGER
jgi:hypothetical protein